MEPMETMDTGESEKEPFTIVKLSRFSTWETLMSGTPITFRNFLMRVQSYKEVLILRRAISQSPSKNAFSLLCNWSPPNGESKKKKMFN
jgi:hypothetical protein